MAVLRPQTADRRIPISRDSLEQHGAPFTFFLLCVVLLFCCDTMAPAGTKRPAPVSDFKRIKAKVGKRAPKPASYTDTSFRKASLHVTSQDQPLKQQAGSVRSSRGRSLTTLSQQLGHTTTSIRQSGAKGLLDIVSNRQDNSWLAHLSVLLPALGQCLVDTESSIRSIGLSVWQQVLEKCSEHTLRPFWEVFMAFVSSAMNSLDRRVRRDSRTVVESASRRLPELVAPFSTRLLPALMRLLDDPAFQYHSQVSSTDTANKRNRNGRQVWLETLVAVLKTVKRDEANIGLTGNLPSLEWTFTPGIASKNSVFVGDPVMSVADVPSVRRWWLEEVGLGETSTGTGCAKYDHILTNGVVIETWTKLRDLLLEILESNNNTETLLVWAHATLALLDLKCEVALEETERIVIQIQGMVLNYLPSESIMTTWMLTLTQLSRMLPVSIDDGRRTSWIAKVASYLLDENRMARVGTGFDDVESRLLHQILDDDSVLQSEAGREIVGRLIDQWEEMNISLIPRLYSVASIEDRRRLLSRMMNFCVVSGSENESTTAALLEFILDKSRNPDVVPADLLDRFQPIWERDVVVHYTLETTQRIAVSLLLHLTSDQGITSELLDSLSRFCVRLTQRAKPGTLPPVVSFVQDAIFDLRKKIAMSRFFGFLMDGTCAAQLGNSSMDRDRQLQDAASYLLGSGVPTHKILTMLWPLWRTWLDADSNGLKRAALSLLAVLAVDDGSHGYLNQSHFNGEDRCTLLRAILSVLQHQERSSSSLPWFQPVTRLLSTETWLWEPLVHEISKSFSNIEPVLIHNCRGIILEVFQPRQEHLAMLKSLQTCTRLMADAAQDGPLAAASRDLTDSVIAIANSIPAERDAGA